MKVIFTSGSSNLNIIKKKGATVQRAVPGGTVSEVTPTSWIKFRHHKYETSNPEEIEIIRQHIKDYPIDRIVELKEKTVQDILKEKEAKALAAMREVEEARGLAAAEKTPEEVPCYTAECPDCGWVAKSSVSEAQMKNKLRGHRAGKHKK